MTPGFPEINLYSDVKVIKTITTMVLNATENIKPHYINMTSLNET
jgi:hypothetical protein